MFGVILCMIDNDDTPLGYMKGENKMKLSECNARQKKAFINIKYASYWLIGGLENTLADNEENSQEYKDALRRLNDHDGLVNELYKMAIEDVYHDGAVFFDRNTLKDIRFCGKDWLMARCEARVTKEGY